MPKTGTLGIDPEQDIAGRIGNECFMCGRPITDPDNLGMFGPKPAAPELQPVVVELPVHLSCLHGVPWTITSREYERRIHDLADLKRPN